MISTRSSIRKYGFSLIEVAIALAIFVIGALAIIRIFPGALNVINNNGDQLVANNLNRSVLARLRSENAFPDATFNLKRDSTTKELIWTSSNTVNHSVDWDEFAASVAGVPRFNNSLPGPAAEPETVNETALGHYRAIQGESSKVLAIDSNSYVLTQFPISIQNGTPLKPTISQDYILEDVRIKADGTFNFADVTDADDATKTPTQVGALFNTKSLLYVSYRYKDADGAIWGINNEPVVVADDGTGGVKFTDIKVSPPVTAQTVGGNGAIKDANSVVPEVVTMRLRQYVGEGTFAAGDEVGDARRGLVQLPSGVNNTKPVVIDYVADWSFLLQDGLAQVVAADNPDQRQIALGAPFVEDQTAAGIYSLVLEGATPFRSAYGEAYPTPDPANKLVKPVEDDLRLGRATFEGVNSADRVRVAYQTRDNWVQQLSIAANTYKPFTRSDASAIERWRDYVLGNDNSIYFHVGEAGKAVTVSYTVNVPGTGVITLNSRPFVIDENFAGAAPLSGFDSTGQSAILQLTAPNGDLLPSDNAAAKTGGGTYLVSIQAVQGTSATVRTAYLNGSRYAQSLLTTLMTNTDRSVN